MLLAVPTTINIENTVTQIKHEVFVEYNMSSTCLGKIYNLNPEDFFISNWKKDNLISTILNLENMEAQNSSTWEENSLSEFDLIANVIFSKTVRVKSRIKSISKYKPHIVID